MIDLISRTLAGEVCVPAGEVFENSSSRAHGRVQAVALAVQCLGFASLLAPKPCRERDHGVVQGERFGDLLARSPENATPFTETSAMNPVNPAAPR